jgi:hypothetical protein
MSYDFDGVSDRRPPHVPSMPPPDPRDLEIIVMLLTLAAIELTPEPCRTFTFDELMEASRIYGGDEIVLNPRDVRIVLPYARFLKKERGGRFSLK